MQRDLCIKSWYGDGPFLHNIMNDMHVFLNPFSDQLVSDRLDLAGLMVKTDPS